MANYNPNSIWTSKKEEFDYEPPAKQVKKNPLDMKPTPSEPQKEKPQQSQPEKPTGKPPLEHFSYDPPKRHGAFFWASIAILVVIAGGAFYFYFLRPVPAPNVSVTFTKPQEVLVGDPFPVSISFGNYSQDTLQNAVLSLSVPNNVSFAGQSSGQRVMEQSVGDIGPGDINQQTFNLIVTGNPNSIAHIVASVTYNPESSPKTQFSNDASSDVLVSGSAISLNIANPQSVFSGQTFNTTVSYVNNTADTFSNINLNIAYPPAFTFLNSSLPTSGSSDNVWSLGTIAPHATGTFTITGNMAGPSNAGYAFQGGLTGNFQGNNYSLTQQTSSIGIASSPLSLSVAVNGSASYVTKLDDSLNYTITYVNNSNVTFQSLNLQARLVSSLFDFTTVASNGSFNSLNDTISWNAASDPALVSLAPGQSGSVSFVVQTKDSYPIKFLSDKNFAVQVNAQIQSPTVPPGTSASSSMSVASIQNKVGGELTFNAVGYHVDPQSKISNTGPYPPKVNKATQYTIHWIITNYATDMENVTLSAPLQSGTTCTGQVTSNVSSTPTCDPATGLVTWQIPFIPATAGVIGAPIQATFQVTNTPAVNQVGQSITLLGTTNLQATDAFTSSTVSESSPAITTDLPSDTSVPALQSRSVTQ